MDTKVMFFLIPLPFIKDRWIDKAMLLIVFLSTLIPFYYDYSFSFALERCVTIHQKNEEDYCHYHLVHCDELVNCDKMIRFFLIMKI